MSLSFEHPFSSLVPEISDDDDDDDDRHLFVEHIKSTRIVIWCGATMYVQSM